MKDRKKLKEDSRP